MEHWEALRPNGYRFVWEDSLFHPGTDTFLLSSLPRLRPGLRVCDLGCGTGLLCLLLLQRQPMLSVTGLDLLEEAVSLAKRSAEENHLTDRLRFLQGDLRQVRSLLPADGFDLAVCNPPYYPPHSGHAPASSSLRTARMEDACTLEEVCAASAYLLRWGGTLCMVHKPERLTDLLVSLRQTGLEPKRLRFAAKTAKSLPSLVLIEARRGGKPGLSIEPPLVMQNPAGGPSAEVDEIYFRTEGSP